MLSDAQGASPGWTEPLRASLKAPIWISWNVLHSYIYFTNHIIVSNSEFSPEVFISYIYEDLFNCRSVCSCVSCLSGDI